MKYIFVIVAYLVGAIPFSLIIGKIFKNLDLREYGSGNVGSTNAARVLGYKLGVITLILDLSKGLIPTYIAYRYSVNLGILVGLFAIIGHCYPIYLKFNGGKAVATSLGVFLVLAPKLTLIALVIFILTVILTGYVAMASMLSAISMPILMFIFKYDNNVNLLAVVIAIIIVLRHKSNIRNLINKKESKFFTKP